MQDAAGMWNGCSDAGTGFPAVGFNAFGTITITANYVSGNSGMDACGMITLNYGADGSVDGGVITVWGSSAIFSDCGPIMPTVIAHELGHAFGLAHSSCDGYIMGRPTVPRAVQGDECAMADYLWTTPYDSNPKEPGDELPGCPTSPVMIALSEPYILTGVADGVTFDLDADGEPERVAWTRAGSSIAFLAFDRNANGAIDDGGELFGDHTVRTDGSVAINGFEALKDFDDDANGRVDRRDSRWNDLLLWRDLNHNGSADAQEIERVADSNVGALGVEYRWVGRRDAHGNEFRYAATVEYVKNSTVHRDQYFDVFLVSH